MLIFLFIGYCFYCLLLLYVHDMHVASVYVRFILSAYISGFIDHEGY